MDGIFVQLRQQLVSLYWNVKSPPARRGLSFVLLRKPSIRQIMRSFPGSFEGHDLQSAVYGVLSGLSHSVAEICWLMLRVLSVLCRVLSPALPTLFFLSILPFGVHAGDILLANSPIIHTIPKNHLMPKMLGCFWKPLFK